MSPADAEAIVARSLGNAFCLEELIRAWAESSHDRASDSPPSSRGDLPDAVIAVAQARLERLDPDARKVLRAASVFGIVFPIEGVSALLGEEPAALRSRERALIEREAIAPPESVRRSDVRELAFRHALLRGAAYATLTPEDRALGHRLAALWLTQAREDEEIVALHWLEAGEAGRAAASFVRAAEARRARAQPDAAVRCVLRALLVTEPSEDAGAVAMRVRLLSEVLEATRRVDARDVLDGFAHRLAWLGRGAE